MDNEILILKNQVEIMYALLRLMGDHPVIEESLKDQIQFTEARIATLS